MPYAQGDENISDLYAELRRIAAFYLRGRSAYRTLQPTALLHEAYVRLAESGAGVRFADRTHFIATASRAMRHVIADHIRRKSSLKRSGQAVTVTLDFAPSGLKASPHVADLLALHQAISRLELIDERKAQVVDLRFFGGLEFEEIAETLGISSATVRRDWNFARAWLYDELCAGTPQDASNGCGVVAKG